MGGEKSIAPAKWAYTPMLADIRKSILAGKLAGGDRLPTEMELCKRYGVSVASVRRGIGILVEEGVIVRKQGSGMFVRQAAAAEPVLSPSRRDTVALIYPFMIMGYHPFFSEVLAGLSRGLADMGWLLWNSIGEAASLPSGVRMGKLAYDKDKTLAEVLRRQNLAGAVIGKDEIGHFLPHLGRLPLVAMNKNDKLPYVAYDWEAETACAIRLLLEGGARKVMVFSNLSEAAVARQLGGRQGGWLSGRCLKWAGFDIGGGSASDIVRAAYSEAEALLSRSGAADGVVVGDDFAAQGVLDAMQGLGLRNIPVVVIKNRKSSLASSIPHSRLVADGYLKGYEMARLLNAAIQNPLEACRGVTLRCHIEHI